MLEIVLDSVLSECLSKPSGVILAILAILYGAHWMRSWLFNIVDKLFPPETALPTLPKPVGHDFRETMRQGILKYPDQAWVIPFQDRTVILPHSSLESHIKKIPEPNLTLNGNMYKRFFGKYTQVGTDDAELVSALRFDLTQNVHGLLGEMAEEVAFAFDRLIGPVKTWEAFSTYPTLLQVVAHTSGRVFVGLPLSRDESWIQASIQHTIGSVQFSDKLREYQSWLRPLVAPFLKERRIMQEIQDRVASHLDPIISKRMAMHAGSEEKSSPQEKVGRMTGWLLGHYGRSAAKLDRSRLVRDHLTLSFAAIHVASMALSHIMHELAARREYIDILREELEAELASCPAGLLNSKSLANLAKMDSFIKEVIRLNPSGIVAWTRLATKSIRIPSNQIIPKGTMIAYCNPRFNPTLEPCVNSDEFDGLRFVKLIERDGPQARYKADSLSHDSLNFGYGIHACPGRAFAIAELKLIVVHIIANYDIRLPEGQNKVEAIYWDFQIMPDPNAKLELRPRKPV
ncbi:cytochrome P450 [Nemania sp. FL0031]|nr:cytochrome P450 [Nemania sp. FL0031]